MQFDKQKEVLKTTHGTSYYIAPEVLLKKYDERCDVWSIGLVVYILLSGKAPYDGDNGDEITVQVKIGEYKLTGGVWQVVSQDAKNLIKKMLTYKYQDRVTARAALEDSWFIYASSVTVDKALMEECMANLY